VRSYIRVNGPFLPHNTVSKIIKDLNLGIQPGYGVHRMMEGRRKGDLRMEKISSIVSQLA